MIWSVVVFHAVADELPQGGAECSPMGLKSAAEIRKKQEVEKKKKNKQDERSFLWTAGVNINILFKFEMIVVWGVRAVRDDVVWPED